MDMLISAYEWLAAAPLFVQVAAGIGAAIVAAWLFIVAIGLIGLALD